MKYVPRTVDILSFIYTIGYFSTLCLFMFFTPPESNRDVINVLIGVLTMVQGKIVESYFTRDVANSATATAVRALKSYPSINGESK